MLTEVLQWAWCYSFCPTPALPFCCFFISLVLAQSVAQLARPTMWTHSCCRALGPFSIYLYQWSHILATVLTGNKGSGCTPNAFVNSIMQANRTLMCSDNAGSLKEQTAFYHSRTTLMHASLRLQLVRHGHNWPSPKLGSLKHTNRW